MDPVRSLPSLLPEEIGVAVTEALDRGATVVTANQRTARTLRQGFERRQRTNGLISWQPPNLFSWDAWTATLWRRMLLDGHAARLLLNPAQEHQVWRSVIAADSSWSSLETVDALATLAADAWRLLCAYRADRTQDRLPTAAGSDHTEDARSFQRWAQAFGRRCQSDAYLTQAELEETIQLALETHGFFFQTEKASPELLLVGFDKMTPAQSALIAALRDSGVAIDTWTPAHAATLHLHAAQDADAELRAAAQWIRQFLLEEIPNEEAAPKQGNRRVALILPSPGTERSEIERVFREILSPELLPITAGATGGPYEFSLGQPLTRAPMIAAALDLLRWAQGAKESRGSQNSRSALPLETVSRLLLSPYLLSEASERGPRAEFDAFDLRRAPLLRPELSLDALIALAEGSRRAPRLSGLLRQLRSLRRTAANLLSAEPQRPYADWAETIRELLQSANWAATSAAPQSTDSLAFQTRRKWESALDQLATLDFEGLRPTFSEALDALETLLYNTLFAPESREAPVQIMGPLEAAGSEFDAVWFLRAGDLNWPVRSSINPLLGWPLQRALGMPGADLAADREHARRVTQRIAASAPAVIFSYAEEAPDNPESEQRPSTLLAGLALQPLEAISQAGEPDQLTIQLEAVADDARIPLADPVVRGGASVLKAQAACGFRAFAERRLWSTDLEAAEPGMDARERGDLVHLALQHLWDELHTQAALQALSLDARAAALDRAIDEALSELLSKAHPAQPKPADPENWTSWETAYLETQHERLRNLLSPWFEQELARQLPFTVKAREEAMDVAVGPLHLKLRIDRVDATEAGDVLIDYKTGRAGHKDWLTERPDEPQLPLYAMLSQSPLAAIAFARIRPGKEMGLDGYTSPEIPPGGILPKPARLGFETLDEQIEDWRSILIQLAEDFHSGDARVRPKSYPTTCQHCAQRLLCRLDPAALEASGFPDHTDHDHAMVEEPHA
ncbi:MAG TPA: PD-(D/E)XK nuclease family protein [Granulicella sp.]|jgi:ATP-dependent helicase/nuclease subunit B|nr:PD-(D/E)XK nuclease family protein [Granulicella sp.]